MNRSKRRSAEVGGSGRWSARRMVEAVPHRLTGADLGALSQELKVTAAMLSEWRDVFLASGTAGPKSRNVDRRVETGVVRVNRYWQWITTTPLASFL